MTPLKKYWSYKLYPVELINSQDVHLAADVDAALKEARREVWRQIEAVCDAQLLSDAITEYGQGYQNAMKELSVMAELATKEAP